MKYCPLLQLFSMINTEDGVKRRGDSFWSFEDFSFAKDTIEHIFTGQYDGIHENHYKANINMTNITAYCLTEVSV